MTWLSPAKINLYLRVLGKRPDGFHELETVMQAIDLADLIQIERASEDRFTCTDTTLPLGSDNLVIKARDLLRRKTGVTDPVAIHLEKQIPHEAGLGGGSSNAATVLWALNSLLGLGHDTTELMAWGAELGSDVPFFLSTGHALCKGRGDRVADMTPSPLPPLWIVKPSFGLSTPKVYQQLAKTEKSQQNTPYFNDLEPAALAIEPRLQAIKEALILSGCEMVLLSGSGTSFFCLGAKPQLPVGCQLYSARPIIRSPEQWYPT